MCMTVPTLFWTMAVWAWTCDLRHEVTAWSAWTIKITDATGRSLFTLPFNNLLVPEGEA